MNWVAVVLTVIWCLAPGIWLWGYMVGARERRMRDASTADALPPIED